MKRDEMREALDRRWRSYEESLGLQAAAERMAKAYAKKARKAKEDHDGLYALYRAGETRPPADAQGSFLEPDDPITEAIEKARRELLGDDYRTPAAIAADQVDEPTASMCCDGMDRLIAEAGARAEAAERSRAVREELAVAPRWDAPFELTTQFPLADGTEGRVHAKYRPGDSAPGVTSFVEFEGDVGMTGYRAYTVYHHPGLGDDPGLYVRRLARHIARINGIDAEEYPGSPAWRSVAFRDIPGITLEEADRAATRAGLIPKGGIRNLGDLADAFELRCEDGLGGINNNRRPWVDLALRTYLRSIGPVGVPKDGPRAWAVYSGSIYYGYVVADGKAKALKAAREKYPQPEKIRIAESIAGVRESIAGVRVEPTAVEPDPTEWARTPLNMVVIRGDLVELLKAAELLTLGDLADACELSGSLALALDDWTPADVGLVERDVRTWSSRRPGFPLDALTLPEDAQAEPSADAIEALHAALYPEGQNPPWRKLEKDGATDAEILDLLATLWPDSPEYFESDPTPLGLGYTVRGGERPAFWLGHAKPSAASMPRPATLIADGLVAAIRKELRIRTPEQLDQVAGEKTPKRPAKKPQPSAAARA